MVFQDSSLMYTVSHSGNLQKISKNALESGLLRICFASLPHFMPLISFYNPENIRKPRFSDLFRESRKRSVAWNGLMATQSFILSPFYVMTVEPSFRDFLRKIYPEQLFFPPVMPIGYLMFKKYKIFIGL